MDSTKPIDNGSADISTDTGRHVIGNIELIMLCALLVLAHHAIPYWVIMRFTDVRALYNQLGQEGWSLLMSGAPALVGLCLCITCPRISGLVIGNWRESFKLVILVMAVPIVLTAIIYPMTSTPFSNTSMAGWLVSPLAQDLLFAGYLYGLLRRRFPTIILKRLGINLAMPVTAALFAFWHVPNFHSMAFAYVCFQLLYTFLGLIWMLIAREATGSIIPVVIVHMVVNYLSTLNW